MYEKADFEEKVVAYAVKNLTKRQIEILALMKTGKDLVCEGRSTYIGNNRTSVRTVLRLLQACAITIEDRSMIGKFERYSINETGREILRRKGV